MARQKTFSYRGKGNTQVIDSKKKWTHAHIGNGAMSRYGGSQSQQHKSKENLLSHKKSLEKKHMRRETKLKMLMQNLDTINSSEPPSDNESESKDENTNTNTNDSSTKVSAYLPPKSPKSNPSMINAGAQAKNRQFASYAAYGAKKQKSAYRNKFSKPRSDSTVEEF